MLITPKTSDDIIRDLKLSLSYHQAQVRKFTSALAALEGTGEEVAHPRVPGDSKPKPERARATTGEFSKETKQLMESIAMHEAATLSDIYKYGAALGKTNQDALRSQIAKFATRGLLKRVRKGAFAMTPEGAKAFGFEYQEPLI